MNSCKFMQFVIIEHVCLPLCFLSYHNGLSDLGLDERPQDPQVLLHLTPDDWLAEFTVQVLPEHYLGELSGPVAVSGFIHSPVVSERKEETFG